MISKQELAFLATQGVHLPYGTVYANEARAAMDAQSMTVFPAGVGIPWQVTNIIDPQVIRALVTPMKAVTILGGETQKGDWTTMSIEFPVSEGTGFTTTYGDFNDVGNIGTNFNWEPRQSYTFQTVTQWGERELAIYGLASISYSTELNLNAALAHSKFMNKSYMFGIAGLQNYGLLTDPSLSAPITPAVKALGGTGWINATPVEINTDIQSLYSELQAQLGGNLELDSPMTLAMSPADEVFLLNTNQYGVSVRDLLRKNFPRLEVVTAPEYGTVAGNLMQLILKEIDGVQTAFCAFTEKMRSHQLVPGMSWWKQKKSGGTWGVVFKRPLCVAQMLGA